MKRHIVTFFAAIFLSGAALAGGYQPGDPAVPVFGPANLGSFQPTAQTPTNFSMVTAPPIAQPAQQLGPASMNQSFTGTWIGTTLTASPAIPLPPGTQVMNSAMAGANGGNFPVVISGTNPTYVLSRPSSYAVTGTTTTGSNSLTITATTSAGVSTYLPVAGNTLSGTGIPAGVTVVGQIDASHVQMSANATASGLINITVGTPSSSLAMTSQPLGVNEDAIVAWDSNFYQQFNDGYAFGCLVAEEAQPQSASAHVHHVDFRLNGGTPITATAVTNNSTTGQPDYCWAAPVSLFAGHNGMQQVDAVVYPDFGWPVVMQSSHAVTLAANSDTIFIPGYTATNVVPFGVVVPNKFVQITNSSDTANFPNAGTFRPLNQWESFAGVYCVMISDADHIQLIEAQYESIAGQKQAAACNFTVTGSITSGVLTVTGIPAGTPGGQIIVGQNVAGTYSSVTLSSIVGNTINVTGTPQVTLGPGVRLIISDVGNSHIYTITGGSGGGGAGAYTVSPTPLANPSLAATALVTVTGILGGGQYQLSNNVTSGSQTLTINGAIPASASGATFTMTPVHAGTSLEKGRNRGNGSYFFMVNPPGTAQSIPNVDAYASNTGNNGTCDGSFANPCATLQGAMLAVTPTSVKSMPYLSTTQLQTVADSGSCTTFTNTNGNALLALNTPLKFDGLTPANAIFLSDADYFVQSVVGSTITLSALPGGPCIRDPNIALGTPTCVGAGVCIALYADYSFTTLRMKCAVAAPVDCTFGHPALYVLGDGSAINRFAHLGFLTVTWDPATATHDNVAINGLGTGGGGGGFNGATAGIGVDNQRLSFRGIQQYVNTRLTQPIAKGEDIVSISVPTADVANPNDPTGFSLFIQPASYGNETTQLTYGGSCIPNTGGPAPNAAVTRVLVSGITTMGSVTKIDLTGTFGAAAITFNTFNTCPIGTPVSLMTLWQPCCGINLWVDDTSLFSPYSAAYSITDARLGLLTSRGSPWSGEVTSTNSSLFNYGFGFTFTGYAANVIDYGSITKCLQSVYIVSGALCDRGGVEAVTSTQINAANGTHSYGIASDPIFDTAVINGSVASTTLTVNSVSSGKIAVGMGLFGSGITTAAIPYIMQQQDPTHFTINKPLTVASETITLKRSIWQLGPQNNTTPGVTAPLPILFPAYFLTWGCGGVFNSGVAQITSWDEARSTVTSVDIPSNPAACTLASGTVTLDPFTAIHEDMGVMQGLPAGFILNTITRGYTILNSQGYGLGNLFHPLVWQNFYDSGSNREMWFNTFSLPGTGRSTYAALALSDFQRNVIFRGGSAGSTYIAQEGALNGTWIFDGYKCTGTSAGSITSFILPDTPGIIIRNTDWPGMPAGATPGSC